MPFDGSAHPDAPRTPARRLCIAILARMVQDAIGTSVVCEQPGERPHLIEDAVAWLNTEDFREICDLAGFDPDWVRAHTIAERLCPSR